MMLPEVRNAMPEASNSGATVIPSLRPRDAYAAISFLERAFGFVRHAVHGGENNTVQHAELRHGTGMVMLGSTRDEGPHAKTFETPQERGGTVSSGFYLIVPDCGPVWRSAKAAGAEVVMELQTMSYGGQSFSVRDPEGYLWSVGEYNPWATEARATQEKSASNGA